MVRRFVANRLTIAVTIFIALRLGIGLFLSDGIVKSDGITYTGIVVNLLEHGSLGAVLPRDESVSRSGLSFKELYKYLLTTPANQERLLPNQWFHAVLYAPFLLLFPSLLTIVVLNIGCLVVAGFGLLRKLPGNLQLTGWVLLLFYPPFFYLTDNFFSEPLFFALLALMWSLITEQRTKAPQMLLCATFLCLTRPLGLAFCGLAALIELHRGRRVRCGSLVIAFALAVALDQTVMHPRSPETPILHTPSVMEALYLSNTPLSNGDIDVYYARTHRQVADTAYLRLRSEEDTWLFFSSLLHQVSVRPEDWIKLTLRKIPYLLFGNIPDAWLHPPLQPQSTWKKILWFLVTAPIWALIVVGWIKCTSNEQRLLIFVFGVITFFLNLFLAAKFRYMTPLFILGMPFAARGVGAITVTIFKDKLMSAEKADSEIEPKRNDMDITESE